VLTPVTVPYSPYQDQHPADPGLSVLPGRARVDVAWDSQTVWPTVCQAGEAQAGWVADGRPSHLSLYNSFFQEKEENYGRLDH